MLKEAGIRVSVDDSDATIGKKIRMHRKMRPAYMLILGEDERTKNEIKIKDFRSGKEKTVSQKNLIEQLENLDEAGGIE